MANFHVISGAGDKLDMPVIHTITLGDLGDALRRGIADFWEKPSHYVMLVLIYPIVGIVLTVWMNGYHTWPLLYPLVGGFALLGPFAAIGLYEISRRPDPPAKPFASVSPAARRSTPAFRPSSSRARRDRTSARHARSSR